MSLTRISMPEIKQNNRQIIYSYIRDHEYSTKQDMVVNLNISLPTVTQNVNYLLAQGLIEPSKMVRHTGGRSAVGYTYIKEARAAVGIYLQERQIDVVAVSLAGDVLRCTRPKILFNLDDDAYLRTVGELVEEVKSGAGIGDDRLLGVGIAVPGIVSEDGSVVTYGRTLDFTGRTREEIARYIPYPNRLFHDSDTAGFAELFLDSSINNAVYLGLNDTVGGSIIVNHTLYAGDTHRGGNIEHIMLVPEGGKLCYCGNRGCMETVCRASCLDSYTGGDLDEFFQLLEQGDTGAAERWDEYLKYLARAIHDIRMFLNSTMILGGRVGARLERYLPELYERMDALNPFGDRAESYLSLCRCTECSVACGAAMEYIDAYFQSI